MEPNAFEISVNGEPRRLESPITIAGLLADCRLAPERVAVELNEVLVRRADFGAQALQPGDRVEIVTLVGGG